MRTISVTGPNFSFNGTLRMHHMAVAKLTERWRTATEQQFLDRSIRWRAPGPVGIEVRSWCRGKADRTAHAPAAKAMIDGLSDRYQTVYGKRHRTHEGWWPDDGPDWVEWEKHFCPTYHHGLPTGLIRVELTVIVL